MKVFHCSCYDYLSRNLSLSLSLLRVRSSGLQSRVVREPGKEYSSKWPPRESQIQPIYYCLLFFLVSFAFNFGLNNICHEMPVLKRE
jgi:hypothetical protein